MGGTETITRRLTVPHVIVKSVLLVSAAVVNDPCVPLLVPEAIIPAGAAEHVTVELDDHVMTELAPGAIKPGDAEAYMFGAEAVDG